MTSQQLVDTGLVTHFERGVFSSGQWLSYFEGNQNSKAGLKLPEQIALAHSVRTPIIRSLQRFQIGEKGQGLHLKKYAATTNDPVYQQCVDYFIAEENGHSAILAQMLQALDAKVITGHWSNQAFISLRRLLGLKTEIFILLIAEIVGKCFYKTCADHLDNRAMKDTFTAIVMDEIFHLEFNCTFMRKQTQDYGPIARKAIYWAWYALFFVASMVFIVDHRAALKALKVEPSAFWKDCAGTFDHAAVKALL